MTKYTIDQNPAIEAITCNTFEDAMATADANAAYTGYNISILDEDGHIVAHRRWWGVPCSEYSEEVISFGSLGYYGAWVNNGE